MTVSWSTALPDWERRLLEGRPLVPELPLFKDEAARALRVFRRLRIPDVIGKPTMAEACGPWFFPIVEAMFGSFDPERNRRMIREYFLLIPKKNSKSSNGGAVMVTAAIMNRRPEAEFMLIAPTMTIANIAFKQAAGIVRADPELDKLFQVRNHIRTIEHRLNGTTLQIKAADTDVITGGKSVGTMIDETHEFSKKSKAADIFLEIRGAMAARPDGFLFQTTTQSKDAPSGVFKSELAHARAVRDGKVAAPMLPILYEFPRAMQEDETAPWKERKFWGVVNPNLGRSVDAEFLDQELRKAENEGIEKLKLFASQHFNIEIGIRLGSDRWRGADHWESRADRTITFETLIERSDVAVAGIDGGGLDDLLGLCVIGRCRDTRHWLVWAHAWCQPGVLELRKEIAPRLKDFEAAGDLTFCEAVTDDIAGVADHIQALDEANILAAQHAVGFDAVGVAAMVDELAERGISGDRVVAVPQGFRLSGAIWGLERKLADGTVSHDGSGMMAWCVGNAKAEQRGNAVLITKEAAGKAKIDPLMAAFNAVQLMSRNPAAEKPKSYQMMVLA